MSEATPAKNPKSSSPRSPRSACSAGCAAICSTPGTTRCSPCRSSLSSGNWCRRWSKWAFIDSLWYSSAEACRDIDGACWSIIPANIRFILFGFFPDGQQWRPLIAMLLLWRWSSIPRTGATGQPPALDLAGGTGRHGDPDARRRVRHAGGRNQPVERPAADPDAGPVRHGRRLSAGSPAGAGPALADAGDQDACA